jgi:hypothetical protein
MVFDDSKPVYDKNSLKICDCWAEYYPNVEEAIPNNTPMERGNDVVMSCFVDADHAGCKATWRLHTGVILFYEQSAYPVVF